MSGRTRYRCNVCGRIVVEWGRVSHWESHNPRHLNFESAPRDQVEELFAVAFTEAEEPK
jgi:hypothetical protein